MSLFVILNECVNFGHALKLWNDILQKYTCQVSIIYIKASIMSIWFLLYYIKNGFMCSRLVTNSSLFSVSLYIWHVWQFITIDQYFGLHPIVTQTSQYISPEINFLKSLLLTYCLRSLPSRSTAPKVQLSVLGHCDHSSIRHIFYLDFCKKATIHKKPPIICRVNYLDALVVFRQSRCLIAAYRRIVIACCSLLPPCSYLSPSCCNLSQPAVSLPVVARRMLGWDHAGTGWNKATWNKWHAATWHHITTSVISIKYDVGLRMILA